MEIGGYHMKKALAITLLLCVLFSLCSFVDKPKVYDDPFFQAKDGQIVLIGEELAVFSDPARVVNPIYAMCDIHPYSEKFTFIGLGGYSICLVHVKTVRNLETLLYMYETEHGQREEYNYASVVELEITHVFIDDRKEPLKVGEIVRAYSGTSSKFSHYYPIFSGGDTYYVVLAEMDIMKVYNPTAYSKSRWEFLTSLGDYTIGTTNHSRWPLHEDGMVEIPAEMMDYGDAYWVSNNYQYRLVPQAEFEAFLRERTNYYEESRLKNSAEYEMQKAIIVEKEMYTTENPTDAPTDVAP